MSIKEKEFLKFIKRFDKSPFRLILKDGEYIIGDGEPSFTVSIKKPPSLRSLMQGTSLALGEAYMDGDIEVEGDLYTVLADFLSQINNFSQEPRRLKKILYPSASKKDQAAQVSSHYDIGNDFYRLWLDDTMSYSCAYFRDENDSLKTAQKNKVHLILDKLYLKKGMTLCDIGCGWGFLLTEAAKKYGIKGLGITLSRQQKTAFEEIIKKEGLEDSLEVRLMDYRELGSLGIKFDRAVSVGMVEHVGRANYELFMSSVKSILKPGGLFLLHFISSLKESPGDPWIKKYIFPGGMIPSVRELESIAGDLDFYTIDLCSLRRHYNKTLLCWRSNFVRNKDAIKNMFDERFVRMWELYLCSCAAAFKNGAADIHQLLLSHGINNSLPLTPWY